MSFCPKCGEMVQKGDSYCSRCGRKLVDKVVERKQVVECPSCGEMVRGGILYCPYCGGKMIRGSVGEGRTGNLAGELQEHTRNEMLLTISGIIFALLGLFVAILAALLTDNIPELWWGMPVGIVAIVLGVVFIIVGLVVYGGKARDLKRRM